MRLCMVVLCCVLAVASAYVMVLPPAMVHPRFEPTSWLHRQKLILELFENVCEESENPMIVSMSKEFSMEDALAKYSLSDLVTDFRELYEGNGLLPKSEIFSEYKKEHLEELQLIYNLFYYANDFDVFFNTAAWARQNVNCAVFTNALYAAVLHRSDTEKMSVPAPYELLPNYFISRDALVKAILLYKSNETPPLDTPGVHIDGNSFTVDVNYTGAFYDNDEESKISYFMEDIGLNSYYYFINLHHARWSNRNYDAANRRGEYWYYVIRQFHARYNLERYTNGLNEIEALSWTAPVRTGYDPKLMYSNGHYFPKRADNKIINAEDATYMTELENRMGAQPMGDLNKTLLMNTIFDLILVPNFEEKNYDWTARHTLAESSVEGESSRLPSVLEHYATSLRDPVFWQLNKNILNLFNEALMHLRPYTHDELYYPNVDIMNVEVKKMQTFFEYYQFDVTDSIKTNDMDNQVEIKLGQPRLNHKPFSIMVNVSSFVTHKCLVKIFLGPKFMPTEIALKKDLLKQVDSFEYTLKMGTNLIIRKSTDINNISDDFMPLSALFKKVEAAELGLEPLYFTDRNAIVGFPSRLILPKGTAEGISLQMYVMIAPLMKSSKGSDYPLEFNHEALSPGYPFDRRIDDTELFDLPNTMFKDIIVTHKGDSKVLNYGGTGGSKKWYTTETGSNVPETGKTFDYSAKKQSDYKTYDYQSKKGSYDYESKKEKYDSQKYDYKTKKYEHTSTEIPTTENSIEVETIADLKVIPLYNKEETPKDIHSIETSHPISAEATSTMPEDDHLNKIDIEKPLYGDDDKVKSDDFIPKKDDESEDNSENGKIIPRQLLQKIEYAIKRSPEYIRVLENSLKKYPDNSDKDEEKYF